MSNIFFTSDEHFGHQNIIKFCNRPFTSLDEMTETLIENHNKLVKKGDSVYHLGDMFWKTFGQENAIKVLSRLNGQKFYIWGNHEELMEKHSSLRDFFIWTK